MWRRKGWKQPNGIGHKTPEMAFEAGADAMLEALKRDGELTYGDGTPASEVWGYTVFIPAMEG